ncbi:hypothetical protein B1H19_36625 [Streptomyces gilvosporeus]|uniref:DUF3592 domain-containing protein n=1 Tax=Streptomyces gilvosporeus TaxID=553510 RepID=A0A1V0U188_9ACTN|nr:hypothetical protein B1H19_36625 [Streptomyces gilvosporeus]
MVRRLARIAALVPLLMVGIGVLGTSPDWFPAALILGVLTVALAIAVLMATATKGWVFFAGLTIGLAVVLGSGLIFRAALMQSRGQPTEVRIISVYTTKGKTGPIYHCRLKRTDGRPMDHANIVGMGCNATEDAGTSEDLLVDQSGWLDPQPVDADFSPLPVGVVGVGVAIGLRELAVWQTRRIGLREAAANPTAPGRTSAKPSADNRSKKRKRR